MYGQIQLDHAIKIAKINIMKIIAVYSIVQMPGAWYEQVEKAWHLLQSRLNLAAI